MAQEWATLKKRNPRAKLVCIDINPHANVQVVESKDVLNVGGFSDHVFQLIADFASGGDSGRLVDEVNAINIGTESA
jgi:60 kDa SS-A/Ro ribonucleoprotein